MTGTMAKSTGRGKAAFLPVGETVRGELDFEQRWRRMQNHSGEHIVSGLVHREYVFQIEAR